ncbi:unnamed protein product [Haemonchus placei]|uniref:Secreted protein n=1 Tax=Haemonchus placei TaxID=6290 RepID=A0A0N4VS66_HAEPC|nr:unnamed protein product [Haemonchus placei]
MNPRSAAPHWGSIYMDQKLHIEGSFIQVILLLLEFWFTFVCSCAACTHVARSCTRKTCGSVQKWYFLKPFFVTYILFPRLSTSRFQLQYLFL